MGNSTRRRSDAHSGAARSTAASRPHCADHWRELSAERQAQSGINQGCEESVTGPGVGQFYFGDFGPGWVKIQSALTRYPRQHRRRLHPTALRLDRAPYANAERGIHIDNKTAATRWCGETMDYGLGIEVLLQKYRKAKRVSAETSEG